jgi:hypothetical protein
MVADDWGTLVASLVILQSLFERQACHPDVITLTPIAARVLEAHDVHTMMDAWTRDAR